MTRGDLLNRMFDAYGKSVTPQRMYYYEEWAKSMPVEMVKKIIDGAVKECDYLPTVSKLHHLTNLVETVTVQQSNVYYCFKCQGGFTSIDKICPGCGEVSRD
jgi:hypothetical protein